MLPDDPRHGSNAGYLAGCRDDCCRLGHNEYRRSVWRKRYLRGVDRLYIDATGTRRRIRALQAIGYKFAEINHALGYTTWHHGGQAHNLTRQEKVHVDTAEKVARVYDELSMKIPPDGPYRRRNRALAAARGYASPLAWDDDTIDDPAAKPNYGPRNHRADLLDPVVVERRLAGYQTRMLTPLETRELVRIGKARGLTGGDLNRLGIKAERYREAV